MGNKLFSEFYTLWFENPSNYQLFKYKINLKVTTCDILYFYMPSVLFLKLILEKVKRRERKKHRFVAPPLLYAFIGGFLHVPWQEIKSATLVYWDGTPANWTTQRSPSFLFYTLFSFYSFLIFKCGSLIIPLEEIKLRNNIVSICAF